MEALIYKHNFIVIIYYGLNNFLYSIIIYNFKMSNNHKKLIILGSGSSWLCSVDLCSSEQV